MTVKETVGEGAMFLIGMVMVVVLFVYLRLGGEIDV
jgi:hypothetical protein